MKQKRGYPKTNAGKKTALVLGGGGSRGAYEIGVWQALREMGQPIHMTTGSSVGSLNAAIIAQEAQLAQEETHPQASQAAQELYRQAVILWEGMDDETVFSLSKPTEGAEDAKKEQSCLTGLRQRLEPCLNEDAIRKSPMAMGLVTIEIPKLSPFYLWIEDIPKGKLMDYILASCACFPAVGSYEIDGKKYVDGGYADNLPVRMALERGADQVIAVDLNAFGLIHRHTMEHSDPEKQLTVIHCPWDLGNFLAFDHANIKRIMRLGYLDTLKTFGAYDGALYCFFKGECDKRSLKSMEAAARIFQLPPTLLYSRERFRDMLSHAVRTYGQQQETQLRETTQRLASALDSLLSLIRQLNSKTFTLAAAEGMKKGGSQKELLLSPPVRALFPDEIRAASWLIREGLV